MQGQGDPIVHVVDDDAAVRESLEALLLVAGFEVVTHDSAEAFLERVPAPEGCLLLDLNMPGMSGLELLEKLRREGVETPVVILTANRDARVRERARELGVAGFLTKPVTEAALIAAITGAEAGDRGKPLP